MDNLSDIIALLEKETGMTEVAKRTILTGYKDGVGEVEVTIGDRGDGARNRWSVSARKIESAEGPFAFANPGNDLATVIQTVHWDKLSM